MNDNKKLYNIYEVLYISDSDDDVDVKPSKRKGLKVRKSCKFCIECVSSHKILKKRKYDELLNGEIYAFKIDILP